MVGVPKFFVPHENIMGDRAVIRGADARHITRVLRLREGARLTLCDGAGVDYACEIRAASAEAVELTILSAAACESEPSVAITLFMALPKGDKMEYVIQKAVELGVRRIVPFSGARCVVRLSGKDAERKAERWQKIAAAAAKQSGRGIVPEVCAPVAFSEVCAAAGSVDLPLFCYECEEEHALKRALSAAPFSSAAVVIGPEGGFEQDEVSRAREAGFRIVSLGRRILRCETAPLCAVCAILYHTDNL